MTHSGMTLNIKTLSRIMINRSNSAG
jgi:hypothetical protein